MRLILTAMLLLSTGLCYAVEPEFGSAAWLYNGCKQVERFEEGEKLSPTDGIGSLQCTSFMAGAFRGYNWATAEKCDLTRRNPEDLIRMFLRAYRDWIKTLGDIRAEVAVGMILDTCMCNESQDLRPYICPLR